MHETEKDAADAAAAGCWLLSQSMLERVTITVLRRQLNSLARGSSLIAVTRTRPSIADGLD